MSIFEQATLLFANMDFVTLTLLIVGILWLIGEIYQPGTVALGVLGAICVISAITSRVLTANENESIFCIIFMLVAIVCIIILICFVLMIRFVRKDWVDHVPDIKGDDEKDNLKYNKLLGVQGKTTTPLRPNGKVLMPDGEYDAQAEGFFISKGETVKVVKIQRGCIYVKKV